MQTKFNTRLGVRALTHAARTQVPRLTSVAAKMSGALSKISKKYNKKEIFSLKAVFDEADADGSGEIDLDEFTKLVWKLQGSINRAEIEDMFQAVDADGSGEIDYDEFKLWWTSAPMEKLREEHNRRMGVSQEWDADDLERRMAVKRAELEEQRLVRTFKSVDADGSGEIDLDEFRTLFRRMAPHLSDQTMRYTFECIDADGSGEVDFDEFKSWWYSEDGLALRGVKDEQEAEKAKLKALNERYEKEKAAAKATAEAAAAAAAHEAKEQKEAAIRLQAMARGRLTRKEKQAVARAARKLQGLVRGRRGRAAAERRKCEVFDEGVANARSYHEQRMRAMRQASAFLGTAPPVSPLTEVEAMRRNALGQHWMAPQWRSPEKRQYEACERNLSREFKLLGKSAGHTMERFDYEKWRRRSLIERPGMEEESGWLAAAAHSAEEELTKAKAREEQRASKLSRLEEIMARNIEAEADERAELSAAVAGVAGAEDRGAQSPQPRRYRRPSIRDPEAARLALNSPRRSRPRWNAGAALSQHRARQRSVAASSDAPGEGEWGSWISGEGSAGVDESGWCSSFGRSAGGEQSSLRRPSTAAHLPRPRSAASDGETTVGWRGLRTVTSDYHGSALERCVFLQERARCTMQVGARPMSANLVAACGQRLARPRSADAQKSNAAIVLEMTGIQLSSDQIATFIR